MLGNSELESKHIRFAQFNANSLRGHMDFVRLHFCTHFHHVISISETWLHAGVSDDLVTLSDYFLIRNDRVGRVGGGVACYVHNSLRAAVVDVSESDLIDDVEYLIIDIRLPDGVSILFASVYRRPKGHLLNKFVEKLSSVSHLYNNIIIGGDLNCDLLNNSFEANHLKDLMFAHSLQIVRSEATHHTATSDSWLDVFIVDDPDKIKSYSKSSSPFIAGHDLLELSLSFNVETDRERSVYRRCYRGIIIADFHDFLDAKVINAHTNPGVLSDVVDVQQSSDLLSCTLRGALDIFAPARKFTVRKPPARWLSTELKGRLRDRNLLYKQAKRANSLLGYARFRLFRSKLNADIRRAKSEFLLATLSDIVEPAKLWRELARLGLVKSVLVSPLRFFLPD